MVAPDIFVADRYANRLELIAATLTGLHPHKSLLAALYSKAKYGELCECVAPVCDDPFLLVTDGHSFMQGESLVDRILKLNSLASVVVCVDTTDVRSKDVEEQASSYPAVRVVTHDWPDLSRSECDLRLFAKLVLHFGGLPQDSFFYSGVPVDFQELPVYPMDRIKNFA